MRKRHNGFTKLQAKIEGRPEVPEPAGFYPLPSNITDLERFKCFLSDYLHTGTFDTEDLDCGFEWDSSPTTDLVDFFMCLYDDRFHPCPEGIRKFLVSWYTQVSSVTHPPHSDDCLEDTLLGIAAARDNSHAW